METHYILTNKQAKCPNFLISSDTTFYENYWLGPIDISISFLSQNYSSQREIQK